MVKYLLLFFFVATASAHQPLNCTSTIRNISNNIADIITKICNLDEFKNSYFIIDNSNTTVDDKIKSSDFFIFNQLENLVFSPIETYKKLLMLYKKSSSIDKHDAVENTEWVHYDKIKSLEIINDNCAYLVQNSMAGVENTLNSKQQQTSYLLYYAIAAVAIVGIGLTLGYFAKYKTEKRKVKYKFTANSALI